MGRDKRSHKAGSFPVQLLALQIKRKKRILNRWARRNDSKGKQRNSISKKHSRHLWLVPIVFRLAIVFCYTPFVPLRRWVEASAAIRVVEPNRCGHPILPRLVAIPLAKCPPPRVGDVSPLLRADRAADSVVALNWPANYHAKLASPPAADVPAVPSETTWYPVLDGRVVT